MMMAMKKPSYSWWFDSHNSPRQSPWLVSALAELDGKTKAMLRLIEQDADSFGQRAEMYYKKRPELVSMVEDFYRTHRSLAEQYDQLKQEARTRQTTPMASPVSTKGLVSLPKLRNPTDKSSRTSSAASDSEESEIDDPEEEETESGSNTNECRKGTEMERMRDENRTLKVQLEEKDEEKRQTIRQLCLAMNLLKEENTDLKRCIRESRRKGVFDDLKKKMGRGMFPGNLFFGRPKTQSTVIAL